MISAPTDFGAQARVALVNGRADPPPLRLRAGTTYRLRLVQMSTTRALLRVALLRDSLPAAWRPVAKDGADLPAAAGVAVPALVALGIGETFDVEVTPDRPGPMRLEVAVGRPPRPVTRLVTLPLVVEPPAPPGG